MEWQTLINIGAGTVLAATGWFCREIWDSVKQLKADIKQIEIDLPSHYVKKDEIKERFDKIENILERIFDRLDQKVDK